jgi:hypothetical protein
LIRTRNVIGCLIAVSLLSGCMAYSEVPPAKKYEIGGVFRVEPATLWSAQKNGNSENWTVNGFGLDGITFITNVADGKPVAPTTQDDKAPTFRADMNAGDETRNLRPYTISGNDAFRFDYSGFDGIGLAKRGTVIGLIDAEKGLNLVIYEGASEHYYDASLADAEKVLASLEKI